MRRETRELAALAPPADRAADLRRYLKAQAVEEERVLALARAFDLGFAGWEATGGSDPSSSLI